MDSRYIEHFKHKLLCEKGKVENLMDDMKKNDAIDSKCGMASELSFYDNHPSDSASEMFDIERGMALKGNEKAILKKIDDAINSIEDGSYGICKICGKQISMGRLEFIPYTPYCIECEKKINSLKPSENKDRPVEESILGNVLSYGNNNSGGNDDAEYDAEDAYQDVDMYNKVKNGPAEPYSKGNEEEYVDKMDRISNDEYKGQLPD